MWNERAMAYVNVPTDLSKVKNKIAFNLTKRQLIVLIPTALIGVALYFFTRGVLGVTHAATVMVLVMVPGFLLALYERDGMFLEELMKYRLRVKYKREHNRPYITENELDEERSSVCDESAE